MRIRQRAASAALFMSAIVLLLPATAQQQQQQPRLITLHEVLRAARDNPDVMLSRQSLAAARADVLAADHAPAPQLTGKLSSIDLQNGIGPGGFGRRRIDSSLGIDWTWERGGKREARTISATRCGSGTGRCRRRAGTEQLIAAGNAFYDLLGAQERIAEVHAIERGASQPSSTATRRVQAGDLPAQEATRIAIEAQRGGVELRSRRCSAPVSQCVPWRRRPTGRRSRCHRKAPASRR